jgi:hypothetical protein
MELLTGFAVAAIFAAVFLTERLGGSRELSRRMYQVALGVTIALTVVAATNVLIGSVDGTSGDLFGDQQDGSSPVATRIVIASAIQVVVGALIIVAAASTRVRLTTMPLAWGVGGVLLILGSGAATGSDSLFFTIQQVSVAVAAADAANMVNFVAMAGATLVLTWMGYNEFEGPEAERDAPGEDSSSRWQRPDGEDI